MKEESAEARWRPRPENSRAGRDRRGSPNSSTIRDGRPTGAVPDGDDWTNPWDVDGCRGVGFGNGRDGCDGQGCRANNVSRREERREQSTAKFHASNPAGARTPWKGPPGVADRHQGTHPSPARPQSSGSQRSPGREDQVRPAPGETCGFDFFVSSFARLPHNEGVESAAFAMAGKHPARCRGRQIKLPEDPTGTLVKTVSTCQAAKQLQQQIVCTTRGERGSSMRAIGQGAAAVGEAAADEQQPPAA